MTVHEPMTLVTDYALAASCFFFAQRLRARRDSTRRNTAVTLWALALAVTGTGAVLGGTYHGFGPELPASVASGLWRAALASTALTSLLMVWAVVRASFRRPLRIWLCALVGLKFLAFLAWLTFHNEYRFVVYDTISAMILVVVFQSFEFVRKRIPSARWMALGVLVSIGAALTQRSGIQAGPFNHNDLYHLVQMAGLWFFYRGGRLLQDRD